MAKARTMIGEGKTDEQIATALGVSRSAVVRYKARNRAEIDAYLESIAAAVEDYAIASKVQRIADYDNLRTLLTAAVESGGATYIEETRHGSKRHLNPAVPELRATLQQAALELDQLPRAGITVNNQNVVIVKQVSTESGSANPEL